MFNCEKCGCCCKNIGKLMPKLSDEKGHCRHLKDNLCSIYQERPLECRVDEFYNVEMGMTKEQYYKLNKDSCELLRFNEKYKKEKEAVKPLNQIDSVDI